MHKLLLPRWLGGAVLTLMLAGCGTPRDAVTLHERNSVPDNLSDWHLVESIDGELSLNDGVTPYDLNTALFTDYAHKLRTVWMPQGSSAEYGEEDFEYPVGTIISKTFYYPLAADGTVLRTDDYSQDFSQGYAESGLNLKKVKLIETRLLVKRSDGWQALPYVWNDAQTEAVLEIAGDAKRLQLTNADGGSEAFTYVVPDSNQCAGCHADNHTQKAVRPIGPRARHLNKDFTYQSGSENQLLFWQQMGYLSGMPELAQVPHNVSYSDTTASLEERARSYLDINCGHCHNPSGAADTSGLMLYSAEQDLRRLGVCKPPVAAGTGSGNRLFAIVPGSPSDSILNFRVESTSPGAMMPELGRSLVHEEGTELLQEWIASMPGNCS
ncbi:SO2930 family diheme c-type cytochrome [Microbulbifer sp. ALW1]|uniref:SO2930 family diheme c-type cytochrome n=1 Tax=Microbulbifer sp. (strain ALW1) TaxID=1516059 RepID=UPI0019141E44|nr:SO2930 family diheme c-type cytochrome [Microbulbifer sp. ALW1]